MATTLGTKAKDTFAVLSLLGLLAVGAPMSTVKAENLLESAIQTVSSSNEHSVLAKNPKDTAKEMQVKADEQKRLLEHYEDKSYLYGKRAQDLRSHTSALIRKYEQAAWSQQMKETTLIAR